MSDWIEWHGGECPVADATDDWIEFTTPHGEIIRNAGNSKEIREGWV